MKTFPKCLHFIWRAKNVQLEKSYVQYHNYNFLWMSSKVAFFSFFFFPPSHKLHTSPWQRTHRQHETSEEFVDLEVGREDDSRQCCRSRSSRHKTPDGIDSRWARWGPLACPAHRMGAHSQSWRRGCWIHPWWRAHKKKEACNAKCDKIAKLNSSK